MGIALAVWFGILSAGGIITTAINLANWGGIKNWEWNSRERKATLISFGLTILFILISAGSS